ncbi:pilus assembly FimT family protein [Geminocystis sp. CENA526]|uniref:pilus assembly FimT family protein n=1 Tax=Geminocystis sp. CENA526 TaxID=1355871 RepID=UPI003D6F17AA
MHLKKELIFKVFKSRKKTGYTLLELLCLMTIMGIIGVLTAPRFLFNESKSASDGRNQIKGILQQTRGRAVSTTSAMRIKPSPNSATNKFAVEIANTRGCESLTKLAEDVSITDTDLKVLKVYSTRGFVVGDRINVGSEDDNEIIAIDTTNSTITLGTALGSDQKKDATVELSNNWRADGTFQEDDITLPNQASFTANVSNWMLCFNSRGIAYIFDNEGNLKPNLTLTISNNNNEDTITILQGGAIETN